MSEWREIRLGDLCEYVTVGHVGKMTDQYCDDGVIFFRSQDVHPFSLSLISAAHINPAFHQKLHKSSLQAGDVVVVRTGYPGTAAVMPPGIGEANCADLVIIRPGPDLDGRVVAGYFNSAFGRLVVGGRLVGAAQQHFNVRVAAELRVCLPDRVGQSKIGDLLDSFNELIQNNRRRIEILDETARSLYREWFVRYRFPGHESTQFMESPLGVIPGEWAIGSLSQLAELQRVNISPTRFPDEVFAHCSIPAFDAGQTPVLERGSAIKSGKYLISGQVVLVSKLNPRIRRVWLTTPNPDYRMICSTEFLPLVTIARPWTAFLYGLATSELFATAIVSLAGGTSTSHQRAKPNDFFALPVVIPDERSAFAYGARAMPMLETAEALRAHNRVIAAARDLLLPKLVTGKIDVDSLGVDDVFGWAELAEAGAGSA